MSTLIFAVVELPLAEAALGLVVVVGWLVGLFAGVPVISAAISKELYVRGCRRGVATAALAVFVVWTVVTSAASALGLLVLLGRVGRKTPPA